MNRKSVELLAHITDSGKMTPVEYMLSIMHDENADYKLRTWAAEKAAPFVHPRPAPVARTINIDLPDTSTLAGIEAALSRLTQAAASGEIAPSEAQSLVAIIEARRKTVDMTEIMQRLEALEGARGTRP